MGMFSTLNYLIDAPLEEILNEVPIAEEIKAALLRKEGRCGKLYDLVLSYEAANWNKISSLAEELGIPNQVLTSVYFICMENVNMLWEQLNHHMWDRNSLGRAHRKSRNKPIKSESLAQHRVRLSNMIDL